MHKRIIGQKQAPSASSEQGWLNVEGLVEVEITSEDATHPIESALRPGETSGWRAAEAGAQTIRLLFNNPQRLQRIWMNFVEPETTRTQEYVLRWSPDSGSRSAKLSGSNGTSVPLAPRTRWKIIAWNSRRSRC